jgi:HEAT repeat protein
MKNINNYLVSFIFIVLFVCTGYYTYKIYNSYENIDYEEFATLIKNNMVDSVEIKSDKIIVEQKATTSMNKTPESNYKIINITEEEKVKKLLKSRPDLLIDRKEYTDIKGYLFLIPYIIIFIAIAAVIMASRRGNTKDTIFREKKFTLNSSLQKARLDSLTWSKLISGDTQKIISTYRNLNYSEQENYLLLLLEAIKSEDIEIRRNASFALREIADRRTVMPLCKMLEEDEDSHVRMNSALTLGIIGDDKSIKSLKKAMNDDNMFVRCAIASALGEMGDEDSIDLVTKMLKEDTNWRVRRSALISLMKLPQEKVIKPLLEGLKDREAIVRMSAVISIGEMGIEEAVPSLKKLFSEEENPDIRIEIIVALHSIGNESTIDPICEAAMGDKNTNVRQNAVAALEFIEDKKAINTLCKILKYDTDPVVRMTAAESMEKYNNNPDVIEALTKALNDQDELVREYAEDILKNINNREA